MSSYGWIIDVDHMPDESEPEGTNLNAKGLIGPSGIDPAHEFWLRRGKGRQFEIRDDDGELYYSGRWIGPHWREYDGAQLDETAFGPLWDFATPNAGATEIHYRRNGDNTGEWVEL